jgi:hypothetical protein
MSIFGKIFGRKKDDLGLGDLGNLDINPDPNQPLGSPDGNYGAQQTMDYGGGYGNPAAGNPQGGFSPESMGFERVPQGAQAYPMQQQQSIGDITLGKDLELISAKLDAIKAEIDAMSQRLKRLERIAEGENSTPANKWNY